MGLEPIINWLLKSGSACLINISYFITKDSFMKEIPIIVRVFGGYRVKWFKFAMSSN